MKKFFTYIFLHFAISVWPFLNFYGSETNHKLISVESFCSLFFVFWICSFATCEGIIKILNLPRGRLLVFYTFFIFWFFSYANVVGYLSVHWILDVFYFRLFYIALLFSSFILIYFVSKSLNIQKFIQVFILAIFSFSLYENLYISFSEGSPFYVGNNNNNISYTFKEKPNVYFLLLDTYAGEAPYKRNLNFDNTKFLDFLKEEGFIIAKNAFSNYPNTSTSLSATFNMNYLQPSDINGNNVLSSDKAVFTTFKKNNYTLVFLPCTYDFLIGSKTADVTIRPSNSNYFLSLSNLSFINTTFANQINNLIWPVFYIEDNEINRVNQLELKGSKFVYIHYLQLHEMAYDKKCNAVNSVHPYPTVSEFKTNISCMNKTATRAIKNIIANDPEAIIIVQGDHGRGEKGWPKKNEPKEESEDFIDKYSIFSAVYFPGLDKESEVAHYLEESPTPVNNFRIIFSHLSKIPVDLLPSRHFDANLEELTHLRSE